MYSFFYMKVRFLLSNTSSIIMQFSFSLFSWSFSLFPSITLRLITDSFAISKLRPNSSIGTIYLFLSFFTALFILSIANIYFHPMRLSLLMINIFSMRSKSSWERLLLRGKTSFLYFISLKYWFMLLYFLSLSKKGDFPLKANLYRMMPKEKTSTLELPYFS